MFITNIISVHKFSKSMICWLLFIFPFGNPLSTNWEIIKGSCFPFVEAQAKVSKNHDEIPCD